MKPGWGDVLVVDDDLATCLLIERQLKPDVGSVTSVRTGQAALELLQTRSFDLLLLDLIMPGLSGYQVLETLKANPAFSDIPVVVVSSADDLEGMVRCIELGAQDYLSKPVNSILLRARAIACLERKWLRNQEQAYLQQLQHEKTASEAANRAKSAFLANMSHELRTPLNAVIGYSEILQEEAEIQGALDLIPDLKRITAAGRHLLSLINDILDISKLEIGKVNPHLETVHLESLLTEIAHTAQPAIALNGNVLQTHFGPGLGTVQSDPGKLRQILFNLLSNAAKFTKQGTIQMKVWRVENEEQKQEQKTESLTQPAENRAQAEENCPCYLFEVSDTGIGIPLEQQENIFHPFTQVDSSTTRQHQGTGLGLAISAQYCKLLGGKLTLKSEVGVGSIFTVRLPIIDRVSVGNPEILL